MNTKLLSAILTFAVLLGLGTTDAFAQGDDRLCGKDRFSRIVYINVMFLWICLW